jgi:hypothetical protein
MLCQTHRTGHTRDALNCCIPFRCCTCSCAQRRTFLTCGTAAEVQADSEITSRQHELFGRSETKPRSVEKKTANSRILFGKGLLVYEGFL